MNMRPSRAVVACAVLALLLAARPAAAQSRIAILDGTGVSVLDTTTGQERARFPLELESGEAPVAIATSLDGGRLFVTTQNPAGYGYSMPKTFLHVLDASTGDRLARISTPWSSGKAVVLPDGSRAFLAGTIPGDGFNGSALTTVDLASNSVQVYNSPALAGCPRAHSLTVDPSGGTLAMVCTRFSFSFFIHTFGHLLQLPVPPVGASSGPSSAQAPIGQASTFMEPRDVSFSPDGSRMFVSENGWQSGYPTIHVYGPDPSAEYLLDIRGQTITTIRAQSSSRAFAILAGVPNSDVVLFDTATAAILGSTPLPYQGTIVTDRTGALTFGLESNRLRRLNNDTAAPTVIATGPGGWLDADVVPDPCVTDLTASPSVFTTTGGSGTLTIAAAASCTWSIDASAILGLTVTTSSGTGPATVPFSLGSAAAPRRGLLRIGGRSIAVEQIQPQMNIDEPGPAAQQPFVVRGWAIELSATPGTASPAPPTVSAVHVWAWPLDGSAPRFIGVTTASRPRPDVAAVFGSAYGAAEFSLPVQGLPGGTYTLVAYAQSARTGTFTQEKSVVVTVQPGTRIAIEAPVTSVPRRFVVSGWTVDLSATTGPGIDLVHVWAYPASGAGAIWVGAASYGAPRPDIAALYGESFRPSGYALDASLPPGSYTLVVFARSTVTGEFAAATASITVMPGSIPEMNIDEPGASASITGPFQIRGWAIDRGAETGSGVDAFHIWAFPIDGGVARFAGIASPAARPDVAGVFGPQFANAGFLLTGVTLPAGTYDVVVYAHSTVTQSFNNSRVVRITVQ